MINEEEEEEDFETGGVIISSASTETSTDDGNHLSNPVTNIQHVPPSSPSPPLQTIIAQNAKGIHLYHWHYIALLRYT